MPDISVAIVDDELDVVRTYEKVFKWRKIPITFVAYDGPEAVEKFRNANPKPRVFIIDYQLPRMTGIEVMREALKIASETKFVILSGDDTIRQEAIKAGADKFLKKPASTKEITETLNALMTE